MSARTVERADFDRSLFPTFAPAAFVPVRGLGSRVWDQSGRELVDFAGGIAVNALGHAHPAMIAALTEQAGKLWHLQHLYQRAGAALARSWWRRPSPTAPSSAIPVQRPTRRRSNWPVATPMMCTARRNSRSSRRSTASRPHPVHRHGGRASKYSDGFGPKIEGITHVPYNDLEALKAAISDKTCAVVLEPIQGESILPGEQAYLEAHASCATSTTRC